MAQLAARRSAEARTRRHSEHRELPVAPFSPDARQNRGSRRRVPDQARPDPAPAQGLSPAGRAAADRRQRGGEPAGGRRARGIPGEAVVKRASKVRASGKKKKTAARRPRPAAKTGKANASAGNRKPIFNRLALIGVGLIGSSIARAAREQGVVRSIVATARTPATRKRVVELGIADRVVATNAQAVEGADLVIVCIPVGASGAVAQEIGPHLMKGATISDVGSVKAAVLRGMHFVPAHPVAGTEYSG